MRRAAVPDLAALHDALDCAAAAVVHARSGNQDSASLWLTEAHAAAEQAFGCGSPEVKALNVVFAAITQAAHSRTATARGDVTERLIGPFATTGESSFTAYRQLHDSLGAGGPLEDQTAGHGGRTPRPALDLSRLGQERTMTNPTTMNGPPAVPSPPGISEPADLDLVRQALADASAWRAWKAEGAGCGDCQRLDPGRCAEHAADDEMAAAYEALLRRLAVEGGPR